MPIKNPLRNFCFTINNYNEDSLDALKSFDSIRYLVAGREVGESGTPHLQGYCELTKQVAFDNIKTMIPTAHIEKRFGTAKQASDYCEKDGDIHTKMGEISKPGRRTDIHDATDMLMEGASIREMALSHPAPFVKYHRGFREFKNLLIEPRTTPPEVTVLYGPTGCGKSRQAREICPDAYVWGPEQTKWFDGYEGQKEVIFEEFRGQLPFGMMLRLLDRYDCRVETKGSSVQFVATKILITSPVQPREWYHIFENSEDKIDQLLRRITSIKKLA